MMNEREKDIQRLCMQVLNANPNTCYNPNGADETTCPFCSKSVYFVNAEMNEINHDVHCAYNIAKDLSTNYNTQ